MMMCFSSAVMAHKYEWRGDQEAGSDGEDATEGETFLQQVGDKAAGEHAE